MFIKKIFAFFLLSISTGAAPAQAPPGPVNLIPGQPVERQIAGGESHTYQITLAAGQFVRVLVDQKCVDVTLMLAASDGKQLAGSNLTATGGLESLSAEALVSGDYQLTVRAAGSAALVGSYQVRLEVKTAPTPEDRQRIAAEALMLEANESRRQGSKTAEQTIDKLEQALSVWRELGDRYWVASSLYGIGLTNSNLTRYEKALEYYEQALTIYREVNNRAGEGIALGGIGYAHSSLSRYEKAIEYLEQAIAIHREVKNRAGEGTSLVHIGFVYIGLGGYEKAIEYLEQALAISREVKNRTGEGNALNNLGYAYRVMGRYDQAIDYYEQALAIYREVKNLFNEGNTLTSLANAYANLSRYEKAIEYFEQALTMAREGKNRRGEGIVLNNLGLAYGSMGSHEKAIEYFEQALTIARESKNRVGEGSTISSLAEAHSSLDRHEKAIEYYEQALVIAREVKHRASEGNALNGLGNTYYSLGRNEKAIEYYDQALAIRRELKDRAYEAYTLYGLARVKSSQGNLAAARTHIESGLKIAESLRSDILSPESRASFLASVQSSYRLYTDLLMRQHRAGPTEGLDVAAFESSEFRRARGLLDLLAEAGADIRQGVDAGLLERERVTGEQLSEKAGLLTRTNKPEEIAALKKEIGQLETELERAQAAIRRASPQYATLARPQPVTLSEIQAQLDLNTVLLEYSLGHPGKDQSSSYLWVITRDSLTTYELPQVEVIEKSAREVYEFLTARSTNKPGETAIQRQERINQAEAKLPNAAKELSQVILAPVAAQLGSKRLIIVADGALQYIPFAMLPDPATGGTQPLVVGHEVVSLPSASTLVFQRKELAGRQPAPKMLAVIADPVFDRTDVRFKAPVAAPDAKAQTGLPADTRGLEHIATPSATEKGRLVIRRLTFTRLEADAIISLAPKNSTLKEIDFQANRTNVLNGDLSQYRYVHFATHGVMDTERPGLSSLVLSTVDANGKPQDGFLRANDIYNMKLPAELVVLSACQTGLGKEVKGEGLIGLTRGFMYAGAKRVVVSLWSVNDKATSDLMTKFYRGILKDNERPAAALRAAQIEMWKQKKWQSPYYWAAFTMQGEWR